MATKFCTVVPNIFESAVWYLLHVTLLAPRIFRWLLDFWKICAIRVKTNGFSISVLFHHFVLEAKCTNTSLCCMLQCGHCYVCLSEYQGKEFRSCSYNTVWSVRLQLKCDGTRRRTGGGEGGVKGKLENGVGSQYSYHYLVVVYPAVLPAIKADAHTSAASSRLN